MTLTLGLVSCTTHEISPDHYDWNKHIPFETNYPTFNMPVTGDFVSLPLAVGEVDLSEASGIAMSVKNPGMIWSHNDSGHPNTIFLLDATNGAIVARYQVDGTANIDWEDIEVASGPIDGESYVYISDTGDNDQKRTSYSIYRFPEPVFTEAHRGQLIKVPNDGRVDRLRFQYPDGSHDTESLLVDPVTRDIFLVTKRDVFSILYVAPYPQPTDKMFTMHKAGVFSFREASAGTSSTDGTKVLIKNRQQIFYWTRHEGESMVSMLARTPISAPYAGEPQGEAVCFDPEYNYYTLSEALNSTTKPKLYKYTHQLLTVN